MTGSACHPPSPEPCSTTGSPAPDTPGSTGKPPTSPTRTPRSAPAPPADPEKAAAWDHAARALNLDTDEHDIRAASRAQLERDVHAYAQAAEAAPPDIADRIDAHRQAAAELARQAELDQADGRHQDAAFSRAAATGETRLADKLQPGHETRARWERDHEPQRLAARAARQELNSRGIQPAPEPRQPDAEAADDWQQDAVLQALAGPGEPGSISAWWQQYTAQADKTEAAIAAEHQAATETGQPWPPRPAHFGPAAEPRTTLQRQPEAGPDTAHVDPAWWAQIKAEQTARVQIAKAARHETAARAIPVTDAEIALYGTRHQDAGYAHRQVYPGTRPPTPNVNHSSPRPPNTTTLACVRPAASTTPGCSHTPDGSPNPIPKLLPDPPPPPKLTLPNLTSNPNPYGEARPSRRDRQAVSGRSDPRGSPSSGVPMLLCGGEGDRHQNCRGNAARNPMPAHSRTRASPVIAVWTARAVNLDARPANSRVDANNTVRST